MRPRTCRHCGLPVAGTSDADASQEPCYCCFGCRFAASVVQDQGSSEGGAIFRLALSIFLSLNVMIFTMLLWAQDVYDDSATSSTTADALWASAQYLCLVFSLPVLYLLGLPLAGEAWRTLRRGAISTDLLLIVGTVAAYVYSIVSTIRSAGPVYYEVGCGVLVFVTLGRWLEAQGKRRATAALEMLEQLLPKTVHRFENSQLVEISLEDVCVGDRLFVRAGERIPCDGRIASGMASIDAQMLTGESRPEVHETGDSVIGGTLNLDGSLTVEVVELPRSGTWRRLLDCIRDARTKKGMHERAADRLVRVFVPLVCVTAIAAFVYHTSHSGLDQGLLAALAVLLIACPCALGLATPMAVWAALGHAARKQVLFRNGDALEKLAAARVIAFDKTGTLTDGRPHVERFLPSSDREHDGILSRVGAAAAASSHELARALRSYCLSRGVTSLEADQVRTLPGRGIEAKFADLAEPVFVGSERLMHEQRLAFASPLRNSSASFAEQGLAIVCVGWCGQVRGVFALSETFRDGVEAALDECRSAGLQTCILTGDHAARGKAVAAKLKTPVQAGLLPEDKLNAVIELRKQHGSTVMVGDGINDAPALAAADVGIALECGADISRDSADVCLLGDELFKVPWAIELARKTVRIVRQNLFWSLIYNVVGVGLAATGRLNPVWAAAAMTISGLSVVFNSLRLAPESESAIRTEHGGRNDATTFGVEPTERVVV